MAERKFQLTTLQQKELKAAERQCQAGLTKIRYQAIRLYGTSYPVSQIEEITGCSRPILMEWCRAYQRFGVAGLVDQRRGGNRAKLKPVQREQLQGLLDRYPPRQLFGPNSTVGEGQFWTVPDLAKLVHQQFGVSYQSQSSYRNLFKRCGFSRQRPRAHYRSRNELKVLQFQQQLEKNC